MEQLRHQLDTPNGASIENEDLAEVPASASGESICVIVTQQAKEL